MATIAELGEQVTTELRDRVERLVAAVEDDAADFTDISRLAAEVGALTTTIGETYGELERMLTEGLSQAGDPAQEASRTDEDEGSAEESTREELMERARDLNVHGRSAMSKDDLAEAVEAEESLTKEELLERAREAGIEGRSSMTKDELRKALLAAGV
jgi:DNA end-binding protein Ku